MALKSVLKGGGGRKTITSRQQGFAVVLQAAQNGEVNKQISETEPTAICDVQCDWLSFRTGSSALRVHGFDLKLFYAHIHRKFPLNPWRLNRAPNEV